MAPGAYHYFTMLDYPVDMGGYASAKNPDEPIVLFMLRAPTKYGLPPKEQYRAGRWELFTTPFEQIERSIRTQLATMLAGGGFDPANDIAAITVNRWSHGYAYEYDKSLWEHWPDGQRRAISPESNSIASRSRTPIPAAAPSPTPPSTKATAPSTKPCHPERSRRTASQVVSASSAPYRKDRGSDASLEYCDGLTTPESISSHACVNIGSSDESRWMPVGSM